MEAQTLLFEPGREFSFVLTEGAVRTWPGSPALMRAQLDRLAQISTLSDVVLGIVPWTVESSRLPLHGFTIFDGSFSAVESLTGDLTMTDIDDILTHTEVYKVFAEAAVYGADLRELIGQIDADFQKLSSRFE